eukprot:GHVL01033638.1.p1 GENE.GHVL01033638.1~~GHVL01033638.1.p1  ORF type:complete len:529 (-),score=39.47 GHVL01033638.1:2640-4226(-)
MTNIPRSRKSFQFTTKAGCSYVLSILIPLITNTSQRLASSQTASQQHMIHDFLRNTVDRLIECLRKYTCCHILQALIPAFYFEAGLFIRPYVSFLLTICTKFLIIGTAKYFPDTLHSSQIGIQNVELCISCCLCIAHLSTSLPVIDLLGILDNHKTELIKALSPDNLNLYRLCRGSTRRTQSLKESIKLAIKGWRKVEFQLAEHNGCGNPALMTEIGFGHYDIKSHKKKLSEFELSKDSRANTITKQSLLNTLINPSRQNELTDNLLKTSDLCKDAAMQKRFEFDELLPDNLLQSRVQNHHVKPIFEETFILSHIRSHTKVIESAYDLHSCNNPLQSHSQPVTIRVRKNRQNLKKKGCSVTVIHKQSRYLNESEVKCCVMGGMIIDNQENTEDLELIMLQEKQSDLIAYLSRLPANCVEGLPVHVASYVLKSLIKLLEDIVIQPFDVEMPFVLSEHLKPLGIIGATEMILKLFYCYESVPISVLDDLSMALGDIDSLCQNNEFESEDDLEFVKLALSIKKYIASLKTM